MIESGLFFLLGFLVAGFIALIIAPAIWRRAVFLTRKRIESAIPLSANELQAEKDKLRAEHAISQRKVELALSKQREKYAQQAGIVEEKSGQIKEFKAEISQKDAKLAELSDEIASLRSNLAERENELNDTQFGLTTTQAELSARSGEVESLLRMNNEAEKRIAMLDESNKQMELHEAKLTATIADLRDKRQEDKALVRETRTEDRAKAELLKNERSRAKELERKYERLVAKNSDLEAKLARREREMDRLREKKKDEAADVNEFEARLADSEAERAELERELADYTLRFNRLSKLAGDKDPEAAFEALQVKAAQMELELKSNGLKSSAPQGQGLNTKPQPASKGDDMLREQLSQLAAEVVHMTAIVEGKDSRINQLLDTETPSGNDDVISLADRIKALKKGAKAAE
ncbi:hypothetical protein [Ahrensia marina]|uniref:Uncharacterized protein n=1 Tax=Ahrensia marina TaxID=1514904 RepID=A0A0M9GLE5_9HYPH|nr:hypothetical protein [Ahrensia marina]KPB00483.1 hypothetical protein SU32_13400 [Ahrensia marina]